MKLSNTLTISSVTPKGFAPLSIFGTVQWFFVQNAVLGSIEMDLISVDKNPTTVMLTWDAATNVHVMYTVRWAKWFAKVYICISINIY